MTVLGPSLSQGIAWLAERNLWWILAYVAGCLTVSYAVACIVQRRLVRILRKRPTQNAPLGRMEAVFSIIAPLALLYFLLEGITSSLYRWLRRGRRQPTETSKRSDQEKPGPSASLPEASVRVATLGPTFFLAGLLCGLTYWLTWIARPVLARAFSLSPGHSLWEYLTLGQIVELGWLLPLSQRPHLALMLALPCWLLIWWTFGNLLRGVVLRSSLQRNLAGTDEATLPSWYRSFGVRRHVEPSNSYRSWAAWVVTFAILLLALAAFSLGREKAAVEPGALAVAAVLVLSWALHLRLRGFSTEPAASESTAESKDEPTPAGWLTVVRELDRRHGMEAPEPLGRRPQVALATDQPIHTSANLSPLLGEIISNLAPSDPSPTQPALTTMQWKVLNTLALNGFVHLDPPPQGDELTLRAGSPERTENRSGLDERHQIVLAPEGSGKTTLAILAAANHTLVHSRSTLLVTHSEAQAEETYQRLVASVESSTVRWNLRRRRVGRDFAKDLSRDIIPDVLVCNFRELVTRLLDNSDAFSPFLGNVGLIVVDDVESFTGSEEIHAQLAFRRLHRLFRQLSGVEQLGEENSPLWLCLGVDSMKETAAWAKSLCGIQAALRTFPSPSTLLDSDDETDTPREVAVANEQHLYSLQDCTTSSGRPLAKAELIAACEHHQVPWHYRPCGDGRRSRGVSALLLEKEPEFDCSSPADACVLLLDGRWSEVHRELRRLPQAGCRSGRREIALLVAIDPDEATACHTLIPNFAFEPAGEPEGMTSLGEELNTLPLPVVRPPSSPVVRSHLIADLLQHWIEVEDLLDTFESRVSGPLRLLSEQGMLRTEERSDVQSASKEYESKVYVRALVGSIATSDEDSREQEGEELPPFDKVRRTDLISSVAVAVRNRADHTLLQRVEADSVGLLYYPGRVFQNSKGRFVVIGRSGTPERPGGIEVEPALFDEVSSPRRHCHIVESSEVQAQIPRSFTYPLFPPEPLLLGQHPIEIGLSEIEASITPVATYRLHRVTGKIRSRELHSTAVRKRFATRLSTVALVLHPNPSPAAPSLRQGEGRLLAALLRFIMPLIYRDVREHLEVALHVERSSESEEPWNEPLKPKDGIYLMDLHRAGNGTARAIYREGLDLPLRFCRHFLDQITDVQRLVRIFDHWGDRDEILADSQENTSHDTPTSPNESSEPEPAAGGVPWDQVREGLLTWLESRLHSEPVRREEDPEPAQDEGEAA
ncbi:MAG: DEAD/DEAH box helicase family protein [Acidobacteriota bacterium]